MLSRVRFLDPSFPPKKSMGCGASRYGTEGGDTIPVKFRPLLHRRFEELRRCRNTIGLKNPTLSQKALIVNEDQDEYDDDSSNSRRPPHSIDSMEKVITTNKDNIAIDHDGEYKAGDGNDNRSEETKHEVESVGVEDADDYDEEGRAICPGSPSFRVYYVEHLANENDDHHNNGDNEGITIQSSAGNQCIGAAILAEGSSSHIRKRGMRGTRIGRVINRGGHAAVKNLKNVTSCYNPSSSAHRNTHLLPQPAA